MAKQTIAGLEFERYIQSAFRIAGAGKTVYIDPHRLPAGQPKADLVLVTHEHGDHLDPGAIDAVRKDDTVVIANAPCAAKLAGKGIVVSVREGDEVTEQGIAVRAVPAYNGYHPRGFNVAYVLRMGDTAIFHGGDTDSVPEWAGLGPIDVALLPIGGTYTMDEEGALDAVRTMRPKVAVPMHYGYATAGDPEKFRSLVGDLAQVVVL